MYLQRLYEGVQTFVPRSLLEAPKQDYGEIALTFEQVINVIDHFDSYNHIEQVASLSNRVKKIKSELLVRIRKEFENNFSNPFSKVIKINVRPNSAEKLIKI